MHQTSRIVNRVLEKDIHELLAQHRDPGHRTTLASLELVATGHAGHVQIYEFQTDVHGGGESPHTIYGVVWDDQRDRRQVRFATSEIEQREISSSWTKRFAPQRRDQTGTLQWMVFAVVGAVLSFAALSVVLSHI